MGYYKSTNVAAASTVSHKNVAKNYSSKLTARKSVKVLYSFSLYKIGTAFRNKIVNLYNYVIATEKEKGRIFALQLDKAYTALGSEHRKNSVQNALVGANFHKDIVYSYLQNLGAKPFHPVQRSGNFF